MGKEDFASLAGKSSDNAGPNFKYDYSYEEMGFLIRKFVPAWRIEIEKFFSHVLFNYLISNGDAHLKNFALFESGSGDYLHSPAYDLINTRIHVMILILPLTRDFSPMVSVRKHIEKKDMLLLLTLWNSAKNRNE